jgi:ABC-type transporter Mla subunit MlaD
MPYERMKLYVGMFLFFFAVMSFSLLYVVLEKKGYFENHLEFYFQTKDAKLFFVGMPVNYSGFKIGTINDLELTERGEVKITFSIKESDQKWIREGSHLVLEKPLIGSPSIAILSELDRPKLPKGSQIPIVTRDDINDIIVKLQPTLHELQELIRSISTIAADLASQEGPLQKTLSNTERFSAKLAADEPLLTTIVGDPKSTQAINTTLQKSDQVFTELHELNTELIALLKSVDASVVSPSGESVKNINVILEDIRQKLKTLDGTVRELGTSDKEITALKNALHINLDKTHQLLEKVDAIMADKNDEQVVLP